MGVDQEVSSWRGGCSLLLISTVFPPLVIDCGALGNRINLSVIVSSARSMSHKHQSDFRWSTLLYEVIFFYFGFQFQILFLAFFVVFFLSNDIHRTTENFQFCVMRYYFISLSSLPCCKTMCSS